MEEKKVIMEKYKKNDMYLAFIVKIKQTLFILELLWKFCNVMLCVHNVLDLGMGVAFHLHTLQGIAHASYFDASW